MGLWQEAGRGWEWGTVRKRSREKQVTVSFTLQFGVNLLKQECSHLMVPPSQPSDIKRLSKSSLNCAQRLSSHFSQRGEQGTSCLLVCLIGTNTRRSHNYHAGNRLLFTHL